MAASLSESGHGRRHRHRERGGAPVQLPGHPARHQGAVADQHDAQIEKLYMDGDRIVATPMMNTELAWAQCPNDYEVRREKREVRGQQTFLVGSCAAGDHARSRRALRRVAQALHWLTFGLLAISIPVAIVLAKAPPEGALKFRPLHAARIDRPDGVADHRRATRLARPPPAAGAREHAAHARPPAPRRAWRALRVLLTMPIVGWAGGFRLRLPAAFLVADRAAADHGDGQGARRAADRRAHARSATR